MGMGKWTEKDTARETGESEKRVNETWHQAREDARESGEIPHKESKDSDKSGDANSEKK